MPPFPRRSWLALLITAGLLAGVAMLYIFDPTKGRFFPICVFHALTGLECPGCGGLRAVHQLSHGHIAAAWHYNPFVVALTPVAMWLGVRELVRASTGRELPGIVTRPVYGWVLIAALFVFGIVRNLPGYPKL